MNNNEIHPTAIVSPRAILGMGNYIGPYCIIGGGVDIGNNNVFTSHVSVGAPAQHRSYDQQHCTNDVNIGNNNTFREFVTINGGTTGPTRVGSDCFIMSCAHISHDSVIQDKVTMANCALIGGHVIVMEGATLSLGCQVHQYQVIGAYSMLGMGTVVPKHAIIRPGKKYAGNPVHDMYSVNQIAIDRNNLTADDFERFCNEFKQLLEKK